GRHLHAVITRFLINLNTNLRDDPGLSQKPTVLCDMYSFLFRHIFHAEVCALYGETIFTVCPNFCEDFMTFYNGFPIISMGMPRWLFSSAYNARKRMLQNFKAWRTICHAKFNPAKHDEQDVAYEPVWGSECIRKMVKRHEDLGFSDDGIASIMLGYLFVTVANSIPATMWMLLYILLDQDLAQRLKPEIDPALSGPFQLDFDNSLSRPLLHSVYCETLRLRIAGAVGRKCLDSDYSLGNSKIRKNIPVMFPNWLGSVNSLFWNASDVPWGKTKHPVEAFWAERFLGDRRKALVKAGLAENWFPFGGGASKCPGESLARHTILGSVVMLLRSLDIRLLDPAAAAKVGSHHRTFPFGSHAFDKEVPIIVRLR
ncbi:cytochrome P450, partial [Diaporthe sp. PMI_573]